MTSRGRHHQLCPILFVDGQPDRRLRPRIAGLHSTWGMSSIAAHDAAPGQDCAVSLQGQGVGVSGCDRRDAALRRVRHQRQAAAKSHEFKRIRQLRVPPDRCRSMELTQTTTSPTGVVTGSTFNTAGGLLITLPAPLPTTTV